MRVDGQLGAGVTAKDIILALIAQIGTGGGTGHVIEYTGSAIRALDMEARMTICNMSIEGGARAGMIAPDDTTFEYLAGREFAPKGAAWDQALAALADAADRRRRDLTTASVTLDAGALEPMITYGTNPGMGIPITGPLPDADELQRCGTQRAALEKALRYMASSRASRCSGTRSTWCSSAPAPTRGISRSPRSRPACCAGRRVAHGVRMLVVPGLAADQAPGRGRRARQRFHATPAPSGARRAARCASP